MPLKILTKHDEKAANVHLFNFRNLISLIK